jgi:hypothetical protein
MGPTNRDDVKDTLVTAEDEVDRLRARTQALVDELERRVRRRVARVKRIVDVKSRAREHPVVVAGVGVVMLLAVGGGVWWAIAHGRERRRLAPRLRRKAGALAQVIRNPERHLLRQEPVARRVAAAVLTAVAATLARGVVEQIVQAARPPRRALPA